MRIVKFIIENYKALKGKWEFTPAGSNFILLGPNGAGKTSAGRALIDVVTKNLPSRPVHEGEQQGYIEYLFDNGQKLLCKLSEDGSPKIELITSEGLKIATPKELFKKLSGNAMDFDIDEFMNMQPKPRRELLEKIVGLDLTDANTMEAQLTEDRRVANAAVKAAKARIKPYDKDLAGAEDVDASQALAKLKEANDTNAQVAKVQSGVKLREEKVASINQKIAELEAEKEKFESEITAGNEWLAENEPVHENELKRLTTLIEKADQIKEAKRLAQEEKEARELERKAEQIERAITDLRDKKLKSIQNCVLPAEGMKFHPDGDGLLIDGLPFESNQVAASRKLIAAIQIATAMLGDIRYLHFDGAALDKKNCEEILAWAEQNDLQLCIERPVWEGGEGVKMEIIDNTADRTVEAEIEKPKRTAAKSTKAEEPTKTEDTKPNSSSPKSTLPWD